jgi:[ribosomal protein S5]-alanine N-acetyltransferase
MRPPPTFTTARLLAHPVRSEDAPDVFAAYANDPEVTRYLAWKAYPDPEPLAVFLAAREGDWIAGNHFVWQLRLQSDRAIVGALGIIIEDHRALFGYVLGKRYWGQGYAAEALRHQIDWALAQPGIHRAWAYCDLENPTSARVMEKAGMTREGILRRWHVCPTIGPEPRDCFVYAKVR